ncbi:MAG TPA: kelch repeat-containing protein [Acidimicrobiales bacterium]|nr:kelch repeat-containing protein [Acidimicrobiales bacterium]
MLGATALAVVVVAAVLTNDSSKGSPKAKTAGTVAKTSHPPQLQVSIASWQLPSPLSRTVALSVDGNIDVFGGLTGTGNSTTGAVVQIDPANGHSQNVATLPVPVHDAAGAAIGSRYFVFGGGTTALTESVQSFSPDSAAGSPAMSVAGQLPAKRADLATATGPDGTVYIAGGYDGASFSPDVLSTRNGTSFSVIGRLPVPVRYPAVAVTAGKLWVLGGEAAGGGESDAIQTIDLKTHAATVAAHLPRPISHASAATLGGTVYLFGGRSGGNALDTVYKLDPVKATFSQAGSIPLPMSDMSAVAFGETVYLVGGEGQLAQPGQSVIVARMSSTTPAAAATGAAPFSGDLLIADRGNDRLLLVTADKKVLWVFPSLLHPAPPQGFYFPDDAFFAKHGTAIITNQEDQNTILEIAYPSGQVIGSYGHPNQPGSSPGYLNQPDDAYLLADGKITVADAKNCRILFINSNFTYLSSIGHTGRCQHDIPNDVAYPNGDTPLQDGNFLVSEINGSYIDEVTMSGQVVWSVKLPMIGYVSDPQQLGPDLYLVADYSRPGGIYEFTREGQIVWSYKVASGEGMLDHPSLAERLPTGLICANDDYRDRVVCINPTTKQIVWQYGDTDSPGTAPGMLKIPDGFDLLAPDKSTPTHPFTG